MWCSPVSIVGGYEVWCWHLITAIAPRLIKEEEDRQQRVARGEEWQTVIRKGRNDKWLWTENENGDGGGYGGVDGGHDEKRQDVEGEQEDEEEDVEGEQEDESKVPAVQKACAKPLIRVRRQSAMEHDDVVLAYFMALAKKEQRSMSDPKKNNEKDIKTWAKHKGEAEQGEVNKDATSSQYMSWSEEEDKESFTQFVFVFVFVSIYVEFEFQKKTREKTSNYRLKDEERNSRVRHLF